MQTGLMQLLANPKRWLSGGKVGLVANPTTVDGTLVHAIDRMHAHPDIQLKMLFGPEHGLRAVAQYMEGVDGEADPVTGLPVRSLYGATERSLAPAPEDLKTLDILVFDIQDVGSRYYTYAATMALCMRVAAKTGTKVLVLDRPTPSVASRWRAAGSPGSKTFAGCTLCRSAMA